MRAINEPPMSTHYCVFDSDIGPCGIAWSGRGLTRLQLPEADKGAVERRLERSSDGKITAAAPPPPLARAVADLQRYFAGGRVDFSGIVLDLTGVSDFYRQVYEEACRVGWGETTTYGELARRIGSPGAARGVGQALSRNPIAVIVPCHRILASGNKIGGFSAFGGTTAKKQLLALEGICLEAPRDRRQLSLSEQW
jgi:methylated-DNA-[protein]-cysteine S-methyltransferase